MDDIFGIISVKLNEVVTAGYIDTSYVGLQYSPVVAFYEVSKTYFWYPPLCATLVAQCVSDVDIKPRLNASLGEPITSERTMCSDRRNRSIYTMTSSRPMTKMKKVHHPASICRHCRGLVVYRMQLWGHSDWLRVDAVSGTADVIHCPLHCRRMYIGLPRFYYSNRCRYTSCRRSCSDAVTAVCAVLHAAAAAGYTPHAHDLQSAFIKTIW